MKQFKKLMNQPLKLALAEVIFSPVMGIEKYIPELQDQLRSEYPHLFTTNEQAIEFTGNGINVNEVKRWSFVSKDHSTAIDINANRIVLFTTAYPRYEGFAAQFKNALTILENVVKPSLCSRIGLRYCDLVKPSAEQDIEQFVVSNWLYPDCLSTVGAPLSHRLETMTKTEAGQLMIRTVLGVSNAVLPPDIQQLPVKVSNDESEPSLRLILDFDHFWLAPESGIDFGSEEIIQILFSLHEPARDAFWKITTDYARNDVWA